MASKDIEEILEGVANEYGGAYPTAKPMFVEYAHIKIMRMMLKARIEELERLHSMTIDADDGVDLIKYMPFDRYARRIEELNEKIKGLMSLSDNQEVLTREEHNKIHQIGESKDE